jgi:hypothetical protein
MVINFIQNTSKHIIEIICLFFLVKNQVFSQSNNYSALPTPINNQKSSESKPSLSANSRTILFTAPMGSFGEPRKCISYQKAGSWSVPEVIPSINTEIKKMYNEGHFLSYDGNQIYFSTAKYGGVGGNDIWFVSKSGNTWSQATNMAKPINSIENEIDPCISIDGRFLFFTRTNGTLTKSGKPCGTIWMSERISKTVWGEPQKLPNPINKGCECNARLLPDQTTLTFASQRSGGKGAYDQYISRKLKNGNWSEPSTIDAVNTANDDLYISIPAGGSFVYYTGQEPNSKETNVIRSILPDAFKPLPTMLLSSTFSDNIGNLNVVIYQNNKSYLAYPNYANKYLVALNKNEPTEITYSGDFKQMIPQIMKWNLDTLNTYKELQLSIKLNNFKSNEPIYFFSQYPSKNYLNSVISTNEKNVITRMIRENPQLKINIDYYIDLQNKIIDDTTTMIQKVEEDLENLKNILSKSSTNLNDIGIKRLSKKYENNNQYLYPSENNTAIYLRLKND